METLTTVKLNPWLLHAPFREVEAAWRYGSISDAEWNAYRAIWRYSAPRLSDIAGTDLPSVHDINTQLDERGRA